jgi:hypothetical protein
MKRREFITGLAVAAILPLRRARAAVGKNETHRDCCLSGKGC